MGLLRDPAATESQHRPLRYLARVNLSGSSSSALRNFPFDVIKIDRQFIADLDDRRGGREVVQAILGLGKALGLSVTAEGVETEGQLRALASDDCDEVQGYLLGRPMTTEQVADLLRVSSPRTPRDRGRAMAP